MVRRHASTLIVAVCLGAIAAPAGAGDGLAPPKARIVDPGKARAQETEKLRLLAKLHADAPKIVESPHGSHPVDAPIFHRYDRPWVDHGGGATRSTKQ